MARWRSVQPIGLRTSFSLRILTEPSAIRVWPPAARARQMSQRSGAQASRRAQPARFRHGRAGLSDVVAGCAGRLRRQLHVTAARPPAAPARRSVTSGTAGGCTGSAVPRQAPRRAPARRPPPRPGLRAFPTRSVRQRGGAGGAGGAGRRHAPPQLDHRLRVAQIGQRQQRGLNHVYRIRRTQRLRQDVLDARGFDDGAHRAAGDHARARRRWLEQHLGRPKLLKDLVRNGRPGHRHADQTLPRALGAFADRFRHFVGFAQADADVARAIADDDNRAEREASAALDDLRHAIDLDDFLLEGDARRVRSVPAVGMLLKSPARLPARRRPAL